MFLDETQKKSKTKALEDLIGKLDAMDGEKIDKSKKPVVSKMSVTAIKPEGEENELEEYMGEAGHEGVEAAEKKLFPAEEASEEKAMISPEEKAKIEELYQRYCK